MRTRMTMLLPVLMMGLGASAAEAATGLAAMPMAVVPAVMPQVADARFQLASIGLGPRALPLAAGDAGRAGPLVAPPLDEAEAEGLTGQLPLHPVLALHTRVVEAHDGMIPTGRVMDGTTTPMQLVFGGLAQAILGDRASSGHPVTAPVQVGGAYPRGTSVMADMFDKQASWGQLILGFAFIGIARRRRPGHRIA